MNNYFVLIYLSKLLNNKFNSSEFLFSYSPHKDVWEGYFQLSEKVLRLIFSANSAETALFLDKDRPQKKSNTTTFFEVLNEQFIENINLADNDRYISIHFSKGLKLLFQLFGNNPNVFLVRDGIITETFKGSDEFIGRQEPEPRKPKPAKKPDPGLSPKKTITALEPKFPRHLIRPVIDTYSLHEKKSEEIIDVVQKLVHAMLNKPEFRVLEDGNLCLIPGDLLPVPNKKTFDNVNDAIRYVYYETSRERRLSARLQSLSPKIEKAVKQTRSTIEQLRQADKGIERAEEYEQYGHLLMAHAHEEIDPGTDSITLPNLYKDNEPVHIPIKPDLSIAENAQRYYEKSGKSVRNVEESKRRLTEMKKDLRRLQKLQNSIQEIEKVYEFDEWYEENETELRGLGILAKTQKKESLPYRKTTIGKYEIWIGKSAKSNDRLTSDAHKEDVWLHARGVSGSHVVIRMNNNKEMPPKGIIQQAASMAAWNSKARGSKLAPVIVTKRKYVTKPKGSATGAVRVQREDVEMVQPKKIDNS